MISQKRIYDICIWFLDQFYLTDGFNDYWYKFKDAGANNPEFEINNLVDSYMYKIFLVIKQEYFDLHDCDIYDELYEFVNNDLYDIYEGKVSYAYRFEAIPDGNPTTSEDYSQAMNRLNSIIEKYIKKKNNRTIIRILSFDCFLVNIFFLFLLA